MALIRIQKLLSDTGVASRRAVEQMILDGRITVNGKLVMEVPCFVDPAKDDILIDGQHVTKKVAPLVYLLMNKPRGVVCTPSDPQGRPTVFDMLPENQYKLLCAASLDHDAIGLVILTNDGELIQHLTPGKCEFKKSYVVEVEGRIDESGLNQLKAGAHLDGKFTRNPYVKVLSRSTERSMLEMDMVETVNREVRRVLARLGHKVRRLKRVGLGSLTDQGLKVGHFRRLNSYEVRALQQIPETPRPPRRFRRRRPEGLRNQRVASTSTASRPASTIKPPTPTVKKPVPAAKRPPSTAKPPASARRKQTPGSKPAERRPASTAKRASSRPARKPAPQGRPNRKKRP